MKLKESALWNNLIWPNSRPLPPFDCSRISLEKRTRTRTIVVAAGTLRSMRSAERPAYGHAVRPVRGFDGDVGWKASRCAISWSPAERRRRSRGGMAFQDLVNREARPSFCSPAAGSSLFPYPFPECPDSWIAPGVGRRDEAAPRGCFDLPVEQRDQRAPFHLPRDHPRVSHTGPHAASFAGTTSRPAPAETPNSGEP